MRVELKEGVTPHYGGTTQGVAGSKGVPLQAEAVPTTIRRPGGQAAFGMVLSTAHRLQGRPGDDDLCHDLRSTDDAKGVNRRSKDIKHDAGCSRTAGHRVPEVRVRVPQQVALGTAATRPVREDGEDTNAFRLAGCSAGVRGVLQSNEGISSFLGA